MLKQGDSEEAEHSDWSQGDNEFPLEEVELPWLHGAVQWAFEYVCGKQKDTSTGDRATDKLVQKTLRGCIS